MARSNFMERGAQAEFAARTQRPHQDRCLRQAPRRAAGTSWARASTRSATYTMEDAVEAWLTEAMANRAAKTS